MDRIVAFMACMSLVALGDILSIRSKAKIPAMAGIILLYLIAISLGMPKDYPELSGLASLGNILFPLFVAALTTNILPIDMVREWKFILIGCISVVFSMLFTILIGGIFLDIPTVFSGAVATCGGAFTGSMLVMNYARSIDASQFVALPLLLATTIDAIGQPIGSFVMQKYVKKLVDSNAYQSSEEPPLKLSQEHPVKLNRYNQPHNSPENPSPFFTAWVPPKYETAAVTLFQLAITVLLSYWLGDLTGLGWAFMLVVIGLIGSLLGFYRLNMLQRTASSGLIMCAIFSMVFQMLNGLSLELMISQIVPFLIVVILSCSGLIAGGMFGAKLFGYDPLLGAASAIGLFYFFPGVQNIITEVVRSYSRNSTEHAYILNKISTPAIITTFMGSRFCLLLGTLFMPLLIK